MLLSRPRDGSIGGAASGGGAALDPHSAQAQAAASAQIARVIATAMVRWRFALTLQSFQLKRQSGLLKSPSPSGRDSFFLFKSRNYISRS